MTAIETAKLKSATAEVAKGTVRGGGSTIGWGAVVWYLLVDRWHVLVEAAGSPDLGTFLIVGVLAALVTAIFRALERKYPNSIWSTLLFSQGAPTYDGRQPQPDVEVETHVGADGGVNVNVGVAPGAGGAPVDAPVGEPNPAIPPPYTPDPNPLPPQPPMFAPTPFTELPVETLAEVAEYAFADDPDVVFVPEGHEDIDAPHGINTPDEKLV